MKKLFLILLALSIAAFAVIHCDSGDDGTLSQKYDQSSNPIYYGYAPDAPEHDAVVGLQRYDNKRGLVYVTPFCSGTLISESVVLTAAHCLDTSRANKPGFSTMKPNELLIYVGDDPSADVLDHLYQVTETAIFPDYDKFRNVNDLALIRLAGDITEPVTPVPHLPSSIGFTSADVGTTINIAGFGETENGSSGVKLQVDVLLGGLGCSVSGCYDGGDPATQISYVQGDGGPCFGDSGGPAFVYRDGLPYVGAMTSYGDSYCTIYGVSTRSDPYEGWIDAFLSPPPAPDCSADGVCNTDCSAGEDSDCSALPPPDSCGDGVCGTGESCDGRAGTAACSADCAGKTTGKPDGRFCYVEGVCEGPGC